jgi:hypothetical protein
MYEVVNALIEKEKQNRLEYELTKYSSRRNAAVLADGKQIAIYHQYHKLHIQKQANRRRRLDLENNHRKLKHFAKIT